MNCLNIPIKRQRFSEWIKTGLTYVIYKKLTLNIKTKKDYKQSNRERQINTKQKKDGIAIIFLTMQNLEKGKLSVIKRSVPQEDIMVLNK